MIQVTLQFASIAAAIKALTNVPEADAALGTTRDAAPAPAPAKPKAAEKAAAPAASAEPARTTEQPAAAAVKESAAADKPKADAIDYPTLQKAVFALAGKGTEGRAAAGELAQSFGVKTFKDLDSAKWGEALQAVVAKTAEIETAVA